MKNKQIVPVKPSNQASPKPKLPELRPEIQTNSNKASANGPLEFEDLISSNPIRKQEEPEPEPAFTPPLMDLPGGNIQEISEKYRPLGFFELLGELFLVIILALIFTLLFESLKPDDRAWEFMEWFKTHWIKI